KTICTHLFQDVVMGAPRTGFHRQASVSGASDGVWTTWLASRRPPKPSLPTLTQRRSRHPGSLLDTASAFRYCTYNQLLNAMSAAIAPVSPSALPVEPNLTARRPALAPGGLPAAVAAALWRGDQL